MDYFFSVRGRSGDAYTNNLASPKYLAVPDNSGSTKKIHEIPRSDWFEAVQNAAGATETEKGNVVVFVHGFNTTQWSMLERHRLIREGLEANGFKGVLVSFDWPSDGTALGYNVDRQDARLSADKLFAHGIKRLSAMQRPDCQFNVHVLAHSMGCYVVREAFDYADDDHETAQKNWMISQIALVAADISADSMGLDSPKTSSLLRHSARVTVYYSPFDEILSISEVKRVGVARRLGRVGLPAVHSDKAVNLYCGKHYKDNRHEFEEDASKSHRWYFEAPRFYEDLSHTFAGKLDRNVIPTRAITDLGNLALI